MTDRLADDIRAKLTAFTSAPKTHVAIVEFSDGTNWRFEAPSIASANASAESYRRFIGADREGKSIVAVTVETL